jgi:hypothetical protein
MQVDGYIKRKLSLMLGTFTAMARLTTDRFSAAFTNDVFLKPCVRVKYTCTTKRSLSGTRCLIPQ